MAYIQDRPDETDFEQEGLDGYKFPLETNDFELYFIDSHKGHDHFVEGKTITHTYYILKGEGTFTIDGDTKEVESGQVVGIPKDVEFAYTGEMELLLVIAPPFTEDAIEIIRENKKVLGDGN